MSKSFLELKNVKVSLKGRTLVDINCHIAGGEIFTIMGPSGSGKSSLLAYIAGFLEPAFEASGNISIDGKDMSALPAEQRKIGLLFQDPLLFPHLSIAGNLRFGLAGGQIGKPKIISEGLETIGLAGFEDRDPATLSGGQESRVALLRLLLSAPKAVLLDEPFSKLDTQLRQEIRTLVFDKLRAAGLPTILVTHDEEDAAAAAGNVLHLQ